VCSHVYRSLYLVELEERYRDMITGSLFQTNSRKAEQRRTESIRAIAEDIDFAAMDARRADLFLLPRR
jgi:hypothetical protein